jgi:hypothetical protein
VGRLSADAAIYDPPIDVGKKRIDILASLGRRIIEQERMFPYIHDEHRSKTGDIAMLV